MIQLQMPVTSRGLPNGVTATYQYDGLDRLTRLSDGTAASAILDNQYTYNPASQITQNLDLGGAHNYDSVDRLASATYPGTTAESYNYDSVGKVTVWGQACDLCDSQSLWSTRAATWLSNPKSQKSQA